MKDPAFLTQLTLDVSVFPNLIPEQTVLDTLELYITRELRSKIHVKAAYSVTFDLLILKIMFSFFKNTVKILKFR